MENFEKLVNLVSGVKAINEASASVESMLDEVSSLSGYFKQNDTHLKSYSEVLLRTALMEYGASSDIEEVIDWFFTEYLNNPYDYEMLKEKLLLMLR